MYVEELRDIDLNHLLVLHILLQQRNTTRAAEQLSMSQPSVSKVLKKLRGSFNDPLLIMSGRHTELTPYAKELSPKLERLFANALEIKSSQPFVAQTSDAHFRVCMIASLHSTMIPNMVAQVRTLAPNVNIDISNWDANSIERLNSREVDLAVGYTTEDYPYLRQRRIHHFPPSVTVHADHPLAGCPSVTTADLLAWPLIDYHIPGIAPILEHLLYGERSGPNLVLRTSSFTAAMAMFDSEPNALMTMGRTIPELFQRTDTVFVPLETSSPEISGLDLQVLWHERFQNVSGHRWFRNLLFELVQSLLTKL